MPSPPFATCSYVGTERAATLILVDIYFQETRGKGGVTLPHVRILNLQAVPPNFGHPSPPRGYLFSKQALSTLEQLLVENNIGETTGHIEFRASHVAGYWLTLIFDGTPIVSGSSVDVGKTW